MDLLEAMSTPPFTPVEQPSVVEEDRVGPSDFVDGARGSSFLVEATGEVTGMTLEVSARPSTAARFLDDGTGSTVSPTLDNARIESPRGFERVDAV